MSIAPTIGQKRGYTVVVRYDPESGTYLADVPTLGFMTHGDTEEEAFEMADEAIEGRLESLEDLGYPIPSVDRPSKQQQ